MGVLNRVLGFCRFIRDVIQERRLRRHMREALAWRDRLMRNGVVEAEFALWLLGSSERRQVWLELIAADAELARFLESPGVIVACTGPGDLLAKRSRNDDRLSGRSRWAIACAALLLAVAALPWAMSYLKAELSAYSTEAGEVRRITLPDGSTVNLNTRSTIALRLTDRRRVVQLLKGEALFEVAHDATRPFEVLAGDVTSRAVGTKFSVRLHEDERVETLVAEGRVLVVRERKLLGLSKIRSFAGRTLSAGSRIVVGKGAPSLSTMPLEDVERRFQWTRGTVTFTGEQLRSVVHELNRYTHRPLVIKDPAIAHTKLGGTFEVERADAYATDLVKFFGPERLAQH
jgi:transmembrane sensor